MALTITCSFVYTINSYVQSFFILTFYSQFFPYLFIPLYLRSPTNFSHRYVHFLYSLMFTIITHISYPHWLRYKHYWPPLISSHVAHCFFPFAYFFSNISIFIRHVEGPKFPQITCFLLHLPDSLISRAHCSRGPTALVLPKCVRFGESLVRAYHTSFRLGWGECE